MAKMLVLDATVVKDYHQCWKLQNISLDKPLLYNVKCFNEWHYIVLSVSNETYTTQLEGLLPAAQYTVAVYWPYTNHTQLKAFAMKLKLQN